MSKNIQKYKIIHFYHFQAKDGVEKEVLESYCWMYSTWNIPREYKGACSGGDQDMQTTTIVYNSYYQWVPLYLIFLAVLFYLPRMFWIMIEGGLMKFFGKGTTTRFIEDQEEKRDRLVSFFIKNIQNKYNIYFCGFVTCEMLNLFVVLLTFLLTHRFLHFRYLFYGFNVRFFSYSSLGVYNCSHTSLVLGLPFSHPLL